MEQEQKEKQPVCSSAPVTGCATVRDGKFFIGETMYDPDDLLHLELIAEHMTNLWNCGLIADENCEGWRNRARAAEAEVRRLRELCGEAADEIDIEAWWEGEPCGRYAATYRERTRIAAALRAARDTGESHNDEAERTAIAETARQPGI